MNKELLKKIFFFILISVGLLIQTYTFFQIIIGPDKLNLKFKPYFFPVSLVYDQEIKFYSYLTITWLGENKEKSITLNRINYKEDNYIFDVITRRIFSINEDEVVIKNFFCKTLIKEKDFYFDNPKKVNILILRLNDNKLLKKIEISCES